VSLSETDVYYVMSGTVQFTSLMCLIKMFNVAYLQQVIYSLHLGSQFIIYHL